MTLEQKQKAVENWFAPFKDWDCDQQQENEL